MKHLFLRRFLPALLCLVLALSLTACGGKEDNTTKDGDEGTKGMISGGKGGKGNVSASKVDPKQAAESLALLQGGSYTATRPPAQWPISASASGATDRR